MTDSKCPECGADMEKVQVYGCFADYCNDGPYHWEWRCSVCGCYRKVNDDKGSRELP